MPHRLFLPAPQYAEVRHPGGERESTPSPDTIPILDILLAWMRGFQLRAKGGEQLRFAVHGPAGAVASPRFHGVPRRDVAGRAHVGVAGVPAGRAPEPRLALARPPVHAPARRAPLARVRGWYLLHPAGGLVLQPA